MSMHDDAPEGGTTESVERFRQRARTWFEESFAPPPREATPDELVEVAKVTQRSLSEAGLAGVQWPREYGGQGLTSAEQQAFDEEAVQHELPLEPLMVTLGMCAPILIDLGTPEQKARHLPPLIRGDHLWCQLFSEPGAGSDLASLQTRAVATADGWRVTGQKIWTSRAQWADHGVLLARTDPSRPKHEGITMFVLDMKAPGVTVRPLKVMTGESPFNEVFLDEVHVPQDAVLGEVNEGWRAALTMLGHERSSLGARRPAADNAFSFQGLLHLARSNGAASDPVLRQRLAAHFARERALALLIARLREESEMGVATRHRGSVTKLMGAVQQRRATNLLGEIVGPSLVAWEETDEQATELAFLVNRAPAPGIAGGTCEVQRNIIGERILDLPKEPQADRGMPFRDLRVGTQEAIQV